MINLYKLDEDSEDKSETNDKVNVLNHSNLNFNEYSKDSNNILNDNSKVSKDLKIKTDTEDE